MGGGGISYPDVTTKIRTGSASAQKPQLETLRTANFILSLYFLFPPSPARPNRGPEVGGTSTIWSLDCTKRPTGRNEIEKIRRRGGILTTYSKQ